MEVELRARIRNLLRASEQERKLADMNRLGAGAGIIRKSSGCDRYGMGSGYDRFGYRYEMTLTGLWLVVIALVAVFAVLLVLVLRK